TDPLTAQLVSGPGHGTLALNADGSFRYTPQAGFTGIDRFVYRVEDGSPVGDSGTMDANAATVTLQVMTQAAPPVPPKADTRVIVAGDTGTPFHGSPGQTVSLKGVL